MEQKNAGKVFYLQPGTFAAAGLSVQGFTTRHEGVSRTPYNSLNLGTTTFDAPHNVQGNRNLLARAFGITPERLVTVNQVHGSDILVIDAPNPDLAHFHKLDCDGIVTDQPGVMLGVCVADCVPLLLLDPVRRVAAVLHAGWKGTAGNIAGRGVATLVTLFSAKPADILAAIGPAIGPCCYEVDTPVRDGFRDAGLWDIAAQESTPGKWRLDLAAANRHQLLTAGIAPDRIETAGICVACNLDSYFSYRRDGGETGRQMGFIMLT